MSGIAAGALTLIGALAILNLTLTLAMIRRLRALSDGQTGHAPHDDGAAETEVLPAVGFTVGTLAEAGVATGRHTVILLTPACPPCRTMLAELEAGPDGYAADALVCVVGFGDDVRPMTDRLDAYRTLTLSEDQAASVFRVTGFPAVLSIEDGAVIRATHELPVKV